MWFKTLSVYRIAEGSLLRDQLEDGVKKALWRPCEPRQSESQGFVSPWGEDGQEHVHSALGCHRLMFRRETKTLQKGMVESEVSRRLRKSLDQGEIDRVTKEARARIKMQVEHELLPQVLPKQTDTQLYVDERRGWIVIDDTSAKRCEELVAALRLMSAEATIVPLIPQNDPASTMLHWLTSRQLPRKLLYGSKCQLRHPDDDSIKYDGDFVEDQRLRQYLTEDGYIPESLGLTHRDGLHFVLTSTFLLKSVRVSAEIKEDVYEDLPDDAGERAFEDAVFNVMTGLYGDVLTYLVDCLGGERRIEDDNVQSGEKAA